MTIIRINFFTEAFLDKSVIYDSENSARNGENQGIIAGDFPAQWKEEGYTWDGNQTCRAIKANFLQDTTNFFIHDFFPFVPTVNISEINQNLILRDIKKRTDQIQILLARWWRNILAEIRLHVERGTECVVLWMGQHVNLCRKMLHDAGIFILKKLLFDIPNIARVFLVTVSLGDDKEGSFISKIHDDLRHNL